MARKQRTYYPRRQKHGTLASTQDPITPPSVATIDTKAGLGRPGIVSGSLVTILGTGLYAGETAIVERLVAGVVPAAVVRTEAGRTRQARTIDLEPIEQVP